MNEQTIRVDVLSTSIDAVEKVILPNILGEDRIVSTVLVTNREGINELNRNLAGGAIKYPAIAIRINDISKNSDGYNLRAMKNTGFLSTMNPSQTYRTKYNLVPILVSLDCQLITNSLADVIEFSRIYFSETSQWHFDMEVQEELSIGITLKADESLAPPEKAYDDDAGLYRMQFPLGIQTYTGWLKMIPIVKAIKVTTSTVTNIETDEIIVEKAESITIKIKEPKE